MISVLINGCNGHMGKEIAKAIENSDKFHIACGFDRTNNKDTKFPVHTNTSYIKENFDVIIDFSTPIASLNMLAFAAQHKKPMVIATTGFFSAQISTIRNFAKRIPIFQSSNMSLQINVMNILVSKLAEILSDCDIEIVETHHREKQDAPSGTALMLANSINTVKNNSYIYTYNRADQKQKRRLNEIGIHSIRGGTEVGKHSVLFLGNHENFEITHTVTSRSIFAEGALKAAEFIIAQKPGLYGMEDLVKI